MEQRRRDKRAMIFANLLNGVPLWIVKQHFEMSDDDVMRVFNFVVEKLKSYLFTHQLPPIPCDSISEAQKNRILLLQLLPKLNLDKPPTRRVKHETINPTNIESAFRGVKQ
jgi:hypothetical protein